MAAKDELTISKYGEISFYISLGRGKTKYPVNIFTSKRGGGNEDKIIDLDVQLNKKIQENSELQVIDQ